MLRSFLEQPPRTTLTPGPKSGVHFNHLPDSRRAYVAKQMRDAYNSTTASTAKKKLVQLASWLEANGEDGAAASLREGLDETLTVLRLGLPSTLRRSFA